MLVGDISINYNHLTANSPFYHTHRNNGRRQEHHKPARARRLCAQIASSSQVARTKARPDKCEPVLGCDDYNAGYVDPLACEKSFGLRFRNTALLQVKDTHIDSVQQAAGHPQDTQHKVAPP